MIPRCLAFLALLAPASGQVLCSETFQYPAGPLDQSNGGTGWADVWDAPGSLVVTPGLDGSGGMAEIDPNNGFAVCWRTPDVAGNGGLLDPAGKWGADGTSLWIRFQSRRAVGALSEFGGLSLFDGTAERLFLGSPWMTGLWGIHDHVTVGNTPIQGTTVDQPTTFDVLIDYAAGDERLRVYLDSPVFPPTATPDLDLMIGDHRWTRVRLASGTATPNGYQFDGIEVRDAAQSALGVNFCGPAALNTTGAAGTILALGSVVVGDNDVTLVANGLPLNQFGIFITSLGQGFVPMPGGSQGNLCLSGGIGRYNGPGQVLNSGGTGSFSLVLDLTQTPTPTGPVSVTAGQTRYFQAWYRDFLPGTGAVSNFTDGVGIDFQ